METRSEEEKAWRRKARDQIKAWADAKGRGFQRELAGRLGYRPSRVSKALGTGEDMGSPAFVKKLAAEYPEWRPLVDELRAIEDAAVGDASGLDAARSRVAAIEELARLEESTIAAIRRAFAEARQALSARAPGRRPPAVAPPD